MLAGGEDPRYIARRLVRFSSEDIGLADPVALTQAITAWEAFWVLDFSANAGVAGKNGRQIGM